MTASTYFSLAIRPKKPKEMQDVQHNSISFVIEIIKVKCTEEIDKIFVSKKPIDIKSNLTM